MQDFVTCDFYCDQFRDTHKLLQLKKEDLRCQGQNKIRLVCNTFQCNSKKSALMCGQLNCQYCTKNHNNCRTIKFSILFDKVLSKKQPVDQALKKSINKMAQMFGSAIDKISQLRQDFLDEAAIFGLSDLQRRFLQNLNKKQYQKISSKDITTMMISIDKMYRWSANQYSIIKQWKKYQDTLTKTIDTLKNFHLKKVNRLDSNITKDIKNIEYLFSDEYSDFKKIKQFNLLYRGSESKFSTKSFHEKCNNIKSLLILVQTQKGKVIGGYNEIGWDKSYGIKSDFDKKSFLFSLSEKKKYYLIKPQGAIYSSKLSSTLGAVFGVDPQSFQSSQSQNQSIPQKADFFISNRVDKCSFNIGTCYGQSQKNLSQDQRKNLINSFTGNKDGQAKCTIRQLQVFELI